MTRIQHMTLAKWAFIAWVGSWVAFAFLPSKGQPSSIPEAVVYLALAVWILSYWALHISLAKGKGHFVSTGIGYGLLPILGLILLAMKKDRIV